MPAPLTHDHTAGRPALSLILAFVYFSQTGLLFPAASVPSAGPMPAHVAPDEGR